LVGGGEEASLVEEDDLPQDCEGEEFSRDVVGSMVTACGLDKNHSTISTSSEYWDVFFFDVLEMGIIHQVSWIRGFILSTMGLH
jgi:hypothetical protein